MVEALAAHRPAKAPRRALVFPGPGGGPLDEKAIYKACVAASTVAELGRVVGPHKLRRTFASHRAMRGTPLPVLQRVAWARRNTTMRHAHPGEVRGMRSRQLTDPGWPCATANQKKKRRSEERRLGVPRGGIEPPT